MTGQGMRLVPATLQRLRCFLNTEAGMRPRPWASPETLLDEFHDALRSHRRDDRFWSALEELLVALTDDMARRAADGSSRFQPHALDPTHRAAVLAEIRQALESRRRGQGRFRRLARRLSGPAVANLLLLGGVSTLGCYGSHGEEAEADASAETPADARPDGAPDEASAEDARDDAAPEADAEAEAEAACDAAGRTLETILDECGASPELRTAALSCVAALHDSWRAGLTDLLACASCGDVDFRIGTCLLDAGCANATCGDPADAGTFDVDAFLSNCCILLYLGVRFE